MSRRNGIQRRHIVQLWIDPAAHDHGSQADCVFRVLGLDEQDAASRAFMRAADCAVADVYLDTKDAPFLGTHRAAP